MFLGREALEDHSQLPKKAYKCSVGAVIAFRMYGGIGMSASSLHRESIDSLIKYVYAGSSQSVVAIVLEGDGFAIGYTYLCICTLYHCHKLYILNRLIRVDGLLLYQFTFASQELIMMTGFLSEQFLLAPLAMFYLKTLEYMRIMLMKLSSDLHLLEC